MSAEPTELRRVAHTALTHAERVTHHTRRLGATAREQPLGHGHYGRLAENAVHPLLHALVDDLAMTVVGAFRTLGEGLLQTADTIESTDAAVGRDFATTGWSDPTGRSGVIGCDSS